MKTLAVTSAPQKLSHWLKRALDGEVAGLRPVKVISADYPLREYGLNQREAGVAAKRIAGEVHEARRRGKTRTFTGSADNLAPTKGLPTFDFAGNHDAGQSYLRGR